VPLDPEPAQDNGLCKYGYELDIAVERPPRIRNAIAKIPENIPKLHGYYKIKPPERVAFVNPMIDPNRNIKERMDKFYDLVK
jgi:hypothetical protein